MGLIKKNIWSLFYIIIIIGILFMFIISYFTWINNYNQFKNHHENVVKIIFNSTNSFFKQQELILDIVINKLDKKHISTSINDIQKSFVNLMKSSKTIIAFHLTKPNGDLLSISSNVKTKKIPNLLLLKESKDSFLKALKSKNMVIGRVYFSTQLNKLILPVRKAVRDNNDKVIAVLNMAISIENSNGFPKENILINQKHTIALIKDNRYRILILAKNRTGFEELYKKPTSKLLFNSIEKIVEKKYKQPIEKIKEDEKLVSVTYFSNFSKEKVISSFKFNKKYNFFVISQTTLETLNKNLYTMFMIYILIYIFVATILYLLFKYISNFQKSQKKDLYYQATHTSLTTLSNRLYLFDNLDKWINDKERCFSLFFIDMDNFKHINDTYGNSFGDNTLKEIAKRLKEITSEEDLLIHYGGDEFLIFLKTLDKNKITNFAQNILDSLNVPYSEGGKHVILRASIGISTYPNDGKTFDELMRCADASMYEAKKNQNQFFVFEDSIKNQYLRNLQIEHELKFALSNNEIYMVYQPQINSNGYIHGIEALVRWENKKLGTIPPDIFISIAEKSGIIRDIGKFIIKTSLNETKELQKSLNQEFGLSINISVKQFLDNDFLDLLNDMIKESNFKKSNIILEITENLFIEDFDYIYNLLQSIKKSGIKISLDDFGTGYSSLSLLKNLPIDELKIDKVFVDDILENEVSKNMVKSILNIGKNFDLHVVVEGAETKEQVSVMKRLDCKIFQGYYFAKPMKSKQLYEFIKNNLSSIEA